MGYRKHGPKNNHILQRTVNDSTTPSRIYINNGSETRVSVPCYYLDKPVPFHNRHWHDYKGWPSPNFPDHCCQLPHDIMPGWKVKRIDFLAEGYDPRLFRVVWEDEPEGCIADATLDTREKNVVNFHISVNSPENVHEPGVYRFTVHAISGATVQRRRTQVGTSFEVVEDYFPGRDDIVYLGELVVLPAGLSIEPDDAQ